MLIIGLTGPSGAGKGLISSLFARYGVPSLDTDVIYHELTTPPSACLNELVDAFGKTILTSDGGLDRRALSELVFASGHEAHLQRLNAIAHRHVLDEVRRRLNGYREAGVAAVLVDAPQLFESGFDRECDKVLSVLASRELRLARIMERDGLDRIHAEARLNAAKSDDFFVRHSDAVIANDGDISTAEAAVRRLLRDWEVIS